jgi:Holliday junction resolvase
MQKVLWFSEDNYYSQEQVEDMFDKDDFGSPFISTKMTRENWTEWSMLQVCCKEKRVRTFVRIDKQDIELLIDKLESRLKFLKGEKETWK